MSTTPVSVPRVTVARWRRQFSGLRDGRRRRGKRHNLVDVVLITLLGMLCGCDSADEIADWASMRREMLSDWFELEHGPPSQDTILRVFSLLNPKSFSRAVRSWLLSAGPRLVGRHIAVDGKALRGSLRRARNEGPLYVVSAWLRAEGICMGEVKTQDKSNEMKAIPILLEELDARGTTITIDAAGCYKETAQAVIRQKADYCIAIKGNQPTLYADVQRVFAEALDERRRSVDELARPEVTSLSDTDGGHGRIEERKAYVCADLSYLSTAGEWPGLKAVGMVTSQTTDKISGKTASDTRYYLLSDEGLLANSLLELTRGHWSVESMHWVLDVVFREDAARILDRRATQNFNILRKTVLSLLKSAPLPQRDRSSKGMSYRRRRRHCGWAPEYMIQVVAASLPAIAASLTADG